MSVFCFWIIASLLGITFFVLELLSLIFLIWLGKGFIYLFIFFCEGGCMACILRPLSYLSWPSVHSFMNSSWLDIDFLSHFFSFLNEYKCYYYHLLFSISGENSGNTFFYSLKVVWFCCLDAQKETIFTKIYVKTSEQI